MASSDGTLDPPTEALAFRSAPHNLPGVENRWEVLSSRSCFKDKNVEVVQEEIRSPAKAEPRSWTVVRRKRAVVVAAMTVDEKLILIRQERIPIRGAIWEVPAGQVDDQSEPDPDSIAAVALRELREETGFELAEGGDLIALGDYFTSPGFTDERGYFFLARPVRECAEGHSRDESESILDCRSFSAGELRQMIERNEIQDANTLALCTHLLARGVLSFAQD
jgi:8-oxo-dGTP pyrophosphatase MutT (NUDIX family)